MNPYFSFSAGFLVALILYALPWSSLYPPLSGNVLSFLLVTITLAGSFGLFWRRKIIYKATNVDHDVRVAIWVTAIMMMLWLAEFIYAGGIPIAMILTSQRFDYTQFGIPTLHVFLVTFSSFYTIFLFHVYCSSRSKLVLTLVLLHLGMAVLIFNRGMLLFNLSSLACVYAITSAKISMRTVALSFPVGLLVLYAFGVLGTIRVSHLANTSYSNEHFMNLGQATSDFRNGVIPHEFFWSYVYISSPIANLQENVDKYHNREVSTQNVLYWTNNEVAMDFISKRINSKFDLKPAGDFRIHGNLTAATIFSRSYSYLGFTGLILMALIILALPLLVWRIVPPSSPMFVSTIAILCTMYLFMMFENTVRFTGLSFQLLYPIALHYIFKRLPALKSFFVNNKVT